MARVPLVTRAEYAGLLLGAVIFVSVPLAAAAATLNASTLTPRVYLYASPRSATVVEGSTFDVSIILDTEGESINGIQAKLRFDASKLSIVQPSSGKSLIGVWVEPPAYDNARGTASYVGVVPGGITTDAGVVGTVTFKAKATGRAQVTLQSDSEVLLNDGLGSPTELELGRAEYTIVPAPPEGVAIQSETHPQQSAWYQNQSPVFTWEKPDGVTGWSVVLDDKPLTVPDDTSDTAEPFAAFQGLKDGVWYLHVKALKRGVWGSAGHYAVRIDTTPPAAFTPTVDHVFGTLTRIEKSLVSFFTTDNHSGIARYEVGVIAGGNSETSAAAFVETESPFQVPLTDAGARVIVRAVDGAGNVRDQSVDIKAPRMLAAIFEQYAIAILISIIGIILLTIVLHYLIGHHVIRHIRRAMQIVRQEELKDIKEELEHSKKETDGF